MTSLIPPLLFPNANLPAARKLVEKYRARLRDTKSAEGDTWVGDTLARIYGFSSTSVKSLEFQRSLGVILGNRTVEEELEWRKSHFYSHHIIHNNQTVYPLLPEHLPLYRNTSVTLIGGKKIPAVLKMDDAQLRELHLWVKGKPPGVSKDGVLLPEWRHFQEVLAGLVWWGKQEHRASLTKLNPKALEVVSVFVDTHRASIFKGTQAPSLEEARDFLYRVDAFGDDTLKNYLAGAMAQFLNGWRESGK